MEPMPEAEMRGFAVNIKAVRVHVVAIVTVCRTVHQQQERAFGHFLAVAFIVTGDVTCLHR